MQNAWENENYVRNFNGKTEVKSTFGSRCRFENNINDFQETGFEVIDWIEQAEGTNRWQTCVNTVMNALQNSIKGGERLNELSDYQLLKKYFAA